MVGAAKNISDFKGMGLDVIDEVPASMELMRQGGSYLLGQQIILGQGEPGRPEPIRWSPALLPNRVD